MFKKIAFSLATIGTVIGAQLPALAGKTNVSYYTFNRHIDSLWVGRVEVFNSDTRKRTTVKVPVQLPTCGSRYYLKGRVWTTYESKRGGYMRNYTLRNFDSTIRNYEGQNKTLYTSMDREISTDGTVSVRHNLTCKSLAPLRDAGRNGVEGTRRRIEREINNIPDPTKGIFW